MILEGKMDGTTRLLTDFWTQALQKNLTTGQALAAAKANMAPEAAEHPGYHWCLCELNLLGDPTLDLRSQDPQTPELSIAKRVSAGKQEFIVKSDAAGADVCIWQGENIYQVAKTNTDGRAAFDIAPQAGKLLVTISGVNLNTVTRDVKVKP